MRAPSECREERPRVLRSTLRPIFCTGKGLASVTEPVLRALDIKHQELRDPATLGQQVRGAVTVAEASKRPVALLVTRAVL